MALFGKKKEEAPCCCGSCEPENPVKAEAVGKGGARVKVLGMGCPKCNALEAAAQEALTQLGLEATVEHVSDFAQIAAYGVMTTPALVVDGKVVSCGRALKAAELIPLLKNLA